MTPNDDASLVPPVAERRPHPITAHGDTRIDDWYWVRDREDPALMPLLEAENAYTAAVMAPLEPLVQQVYREILDHTQLTDVSYPVPKGAWGYYTRTMEGANYSVFCRRPVEAPLPRPGEGAGGGAGGPADPNETVLLDENELARDHEYFDVGDRALSPDQRLLAYAVDTTGSELMTIRVRDLETGQDLDDVIEGAYYGLAFAADNLTLFYTRTDESRRPYQVWCHHLGTPTEADVRVFEEEDERFEVGVDKTKDERMIVIGCHSRLTSEWRFVPADAPGSEPEVVTPRRHDVLYSVEHHVGEWLILTNDGAENFALHRAPVGDSGRESWQLLMAERDDVLLEDLDVIAGHALVEERGHATTAIRVLPLGGGEPRLIEAPPAGTVFLAHNWEFSTSSIRYQTSTLVDPPTLHEIDLETGEARVLRRLPVPNYDPDAYRTEQVWAKSLDGTEVPITLAWRADRPSGPGPAMLYGYGAYGSSTDPAWPPRRVIHPLLDRGVLYAIAHVRGGEELGRHWYLEGKLDKKRHSFQDFIAAAHFLVADGRTTPAQLAAMGGSAGGLLMGASVNLDPDAFGAVVAAVPFVDCTTTMLDPSLPLTTNEWEEWGDPVSSEDAYRCIKDYSPYDNVQQRRYPRMLVTSGFTDPRVGYFEPVKWVQKLRAASPENAPGILLKMELSAGHFGPSGRYEAWNRWAFVLAFVLDATGAASGVGATPTTEAPTG